MRHHYPELVANVLSVNLARVRANPDTPSRSTGIDKAAAHEPVMVRAPGPMRGGLGSGLVGDTIGDRKVHGGDDQAVYAYAREDLDRWETRLARPLTNGVFGENLTTSGVGVTEARIGERWGIGTDGLVLEVCAPRTPCRTFSAFLQLDHWIKTFTEAAKPGAYLRVISPGMVPRRRRNLHRLPARSRRDDRPRIPGTHVGSEPASAVVGGRCALN